MDTPPTFRQANIDDLPFIKELSLRVFSIFGHYDSILSRRFPDPDVFTLISEIGKEKSGFAMLELLRGPNLLPIWGEMIAIAVDPIYQGKKIGKGLLSKTEELASTYGLRYLNLHVASDNHRALELFQKRGYKILESISAYYPQGQKALHMARPILHNQSGLYPFNRTQ